MNGQATEEVHRQFEAAVARVLEEFCTRAHLSWPTRDGTSYCLVNQDQETGEPQQWRVFLEPDPDGTTAAIELSFTLTETDGTDGCVASDVEATRRAQCGGIETWDNRTATWLPTLNEPELPA